MGKKRRLPDPEAVLEGRASADLETLVTLIHRANPTGRGQPAEVERRRYARKSALQSLLIRDFGEHLRVEAEAEGVVLLRLLSGRDAAHAVLDALDEDARAWLRYQLDTVDAPRASPTPTEAAMAPGDALSRGHEALADYDFEAAEAHYERAIAESPAEAAPALALLEMLVDGLAADERALERYGRLPRRIAGAGPLRALAAVAAARQGEGKQLSRLVEGLDHPRVAEAWLLAGRAQLEAGDFVGAAQAARRAAEADPQAGSRSLIAEIDARRALAREPELSALRALIETAPEAALQRAKALLRQWPDCSEARAAITRLERARSQALAEAARARGRAAMETGDWHAALTALKRARQAVDLPGLEAELEQVRQRVAQEDAELHRERVHARLAATPDDEDALLAWLQLGEASPERGPRRWLPRGPHGRREAHELVRAALAAEAAEEHLEAGRGRQASALVNKYALEALVGGEALRARVHASLGARERALTEARAARLQAALDAVDLAALTPEGDPRPGLETVRRLHAEAGGVTPPRVQALLERLEQRVRIDERLSAGAPLEAREALNALLDLEPGLEAPWSRSAAEIQAAVDAVWPVERFEGEPIPLPFDHQGYARYPQAQPWARAEGGVVLLNTIAEGLWLRWLDASGQIERSASLHGPMPLAAEDFLVTADRIVVLERQGLLELDHQGALLRRIDHARWSPPYRGEGFLLDADTLCDEALGEDALLRDLHSTRVVSDLRCGMATPGRGPGTSFVLGEVDGGLTVSDARGRRLATLNELSHAATGAADGSRRYFIGYLGLDNADARLFVLDAEGLRPLRQIHLGDTDYPTSMAVSPEGLILLHLDQEEGPTISLIPEDTSMPLRRLSRAHRRSQLIVDETGRARARLDTRRLCDLDVPHEGARDQLQEFLRRDGLQLMMQPGTDPQALVRRAMAETSSREAERAFDRGDLSALLEYVALGRKHRGHLARLFPRMLERWPERMDVRRALAADLARCGQLAEALGLLDGARHPEDLCSENSLNRARAVLCLQIGDHAGALQAAEMVEPEDWEDEDFLTLCRQLAGVEPATWSPVRAVLQAQALLGAPRAERLRALDDEDLWALARPAALAPVIEACLEEGEPLDARRRLALGFFESLGPPNDLRYHRMGALGFTDEAHSALLERVRQALGIQPEPIDGASAF